MAADNAAPGSYSFMQYEALQTAIANNEVDLVKQMLADHSMTSLEKGYLLDLARPGGHQQIIALLEAVPVKQQG